ncbi:MAG: RsmF rRNA methyltransferase first C-terminal domain-containing protein [Erysipelotrichaceae bacterium]|nr:RsmF rRNA methyltransferase first C-terminal domain-containing protein [Erysipelotrichaceae bacterium]
MKELFEQRVRSYFGEDSNLFLTKLNEPATQALFLNTSKANKDKILSLIDFPLKKSPLSNENYYYESDNIGKTKAYELGLIYPQDIAASLTTSFFKDKNINIIVDMCAAPGGKSINILNRVNKDALLIANDVSHDRASILTSNLERLGLDNVIITNKDTSILSEQLSGYADLVILDAPCSGEGMIRKFPEIFDTYSLSNIENLAQIQKKLLEEAYVMLSRGGFLVYSTCTYAFEEDEDQIESFLQRHSDMKLVKIDMPSFSRIEGTVKLSPLNDTEGQFFAIMIKEGEEESSRIKPLKTVKEKLVDDFIKENLLIKDYYLYKYNEHFYLSLKSLPDLKNSIMRYGIYLGDVVKKRFEPSHALYRSNTLIGKFRYVYDLHDKEYDSFISGNELKINEESHYYLVTYKGISLGYGKCSNGILKNKYPKGLRRML